jgi:hypothetical protein
VPEYTDDDPFHLEIVRIKFSRHNLSVATMNPATSPKRTMTMRNIILPALALAAGLAAGPAFAGDITFNNRSSLTATGDARSQTVTAGRTATAQGGVASVQSAGTSSGSITVDRRSDISLDGRVRAQDVSAQGRNAVAQAGVASVQTAAHD